MFHSIGIYGKRELYQANKKAEQLIAEGKPNVHIEIIWTEFNIATCGPYLGFYVNYGEQPCDDFDPDFGFDNAEGDYPDWD